MTDPGRRHTFPTGHDVVTFLTDQHQQIKSLFATTLAASGDQREESFFELRRLLAVHETAEEQIVHPKAKDTITNGQTVVAERLAEEQEAKEALAALEDMDIDSAEFTTHLTALRDDVIAHAEAEEQHEFPGLVDALDDEQLQRMERMVAAVEKIAPTRPHPNVKGRAANLIGGPFVAMADRIRDAM